MAKEEKKNVGALDDEAVGNVSGGKAYWTKKPPINLNPGKINLTGRQKNITPELLEKWNANQNKK